MPRCVEIRASAGACSQPAIAMATLYQRIKGEVATYTQTGEIQYACNLGHSNATPFIQYELDMTREEVCLSCCGGSYKVWTSSRFFLEYNFGEGTNQCFRELKRYQYIN